MPCKGTHSNPLQRQTWHLSLSFSHSPSQLCCKTLLHHSFTNKKFHLFHTVYYIYIKVSSNPPALPSFLLIFPLYLVCLMNFLSNFSCQVLLTVEVIWNRYPRGLVKYDPEVLLKSFYLANQCKFYILFHNRSVFLLIVKQYFTPFHRYKNLYPQEDVLCLSGSFKDLPPPLSTEWHISCPVHSPRSDMRNRLLMSRLQW